MRPPRTDWKRTPERQRGHRLDPAASSAIWEAFLGYLASMSATEASKRPGMPSRVAFAKKRARDRDFNARATAALAGRKLETSGRTRISPEAWIAFLAHLPTMSTRRLALLEGMPSEAAVYKRRQADPEFRAQLDAVLHNTRRGRERRTASALRMIELRRDPEFIDRMELSLAAWRARPGSITKHTRGGKVQLGEVFTAALLQNDLYAAVSAAVPAHMQPEARADVIADLVLAILEREVDLGDLPAAVKEFTKRHWRMFGTFKTISLDTPAGPDSRETIGDRLSEEAGRFWA